jgi:hypothetical protein
VARLRGRRAELPSSPSIDPAGYARAWRARASLSRAVNPVHELLRQASAGAPPSLRPRIMALVAPERLEERLAAAVDAAVFQAGTDRAPAPRARLWTVIGLLQAIATGAVAVAVAWYATLFLAGQAHADLPRLPTWHRVPLPLVLLVAGVAGSLVLARLLRWSARRAAGRWADRLTGELDGTVSREVEDAISAPLASLESARAELLVRLADLREAAAA